MPAAAQLGLLEEEPRGGTLTTMLQGLNRFLMEKIVLDYRNMAPASDVYAHQVSLQTAPKLSARKLKLQVTCHFGHNIYSVHGLSNRTYSTRDHLYQ